MSAGAPQDPMVRLHIIAELGVWPILRDDTGSSVAPSTSFV